MASTTALPPPTSIEQDKRPANFVCWLFATRPVPATSSAGCVCYKACAGQLHHRPVLLHRPCLAMPCLPAFAMTPCLLPLWHLPHSIHYHVHQDHRAFCRDCPVGSHITGLHWWPVHRLCSLRSFQRGRPRTACEQPATFPVTCIVSRARDCV